MPYALHVFKVKSDAYRWVNVKFDGEPIRPNSHSYDDCHTYCDALHASTLASPAEGRQLSEIEAGAPVEDSDSETDVYPAARSVRHHRGEARI